MELCGQWLGLRSSCPSPPPPPPPPPPPRLPSPLALISPNHFELFPLRLIPLCFSKLPQITGASSRARPFSQELDLLRSHHYNSAILSDILPPPPLHPSPSIPPFPTLTFLSSFPSFIAEKCFMHSNTRVIFVRQHFRRNRERETHTHTKKENPVSALGVSVSFSAKERHTNTS